jgi:PAS domain S-box-containing protein
LFGTLWERRRIRILYLANSSADADPALAILRGAGFSIVPFIVTSRAEFEAAVARGGVDLVLSGYALEGWTGMDALAILQRQGTDLPFILVTGTLDTDAAVECVRQGASDYVLKDHLGRLPQAVNRALHERRLREERRQARRMLADSERRFRCLTLATSDLIWVTDRVGRMHGRLARWQSYTGQQAAELSAYGWLDAIHPDDRGQLHRALDQAIQHPESFSLEVRIRRADGVYRRFGLSAVPVRESDGTLIEWVGAANDITDRVEAETALRESEQRYRELTDSIFDGVVLTEHGLIIEANPGFAAMVGREPDELVGTALLDLLEEGSRAELTSHLSGGPQQFECVARGRDRNRIELEAFSRPSLLRGRLVRLTAVRDRTAQLELERQFLHAQRLEAVGQLAGGIAHDFNNILTSVLGFSQFLIDQLPPDSPHRADAAEIHRAGELAAALTRKLLAFSRRQAVRPEVLDLNVVARESTELLGRMLGSDVRLELQLTARPSLVVADTGQVEQVLLNLAVNARDAMPRGGRLSVATSACELAAGLAYDGGLVPPGRYVLLTVADNGTGMTPETRRRIFEPFFTTKGGSRGTGLGLSTVYGIMQQVRGHIVVTTAPEQGTRFDLYFPTAAPGSAPGTPVTRPLGAARGDERILLVEDEPAVRTLTERVLSRAGYHVMAAPDGSTARVLASEAALLQLILMDVLLPGERGPGVASELLERHPEARIVFISGIDGLAGEENLPPGRHWFLSKPFTQSQLLGVVRAALDGAPASRPESGIASPASNS